MTHDKLLSQAAVDYFIAAAYDGNYDELEPAMYDEGEAAVFYLTALHWQRFPELEGIDCVRVTADNSVHVFNLDLPSF